MSRTVAFDVGIELANRRATQQQKRRAEDRDLQRRATRLPAPSLSETPRRCATCFEWASANQYGQCKACHCPFVALPLIGLKKAG